MSVPLRIFIGYDEKEPVSFYVLQHSIIRRCHAGVPIAITPINRTLLGNRYMRAIDPTETTQFSLARFWVPSLCDFKGYAIFMDCDQLMLTDIADVFLHTPRLPERAVYVCQHDYVPKEQQKFLGQPQTAYPMKNWSSFMVFNNAHCKGLTEQFCNTASGLELHRFTWTAPEQIGALPLDWNWLVGEYAPNVQAKNLHYTLGGPWFQATANCDQADLWWAEYDHMRRCAQGAEKLKAAV